MKHKNREVETATESRQGFRPPIYPVSRMPASALPTWEKVHPVALLDTAAHATQTDGCDIRLGWDPQALFLQIRFPGPQTLAPAPPQSPDAFWQQNHAEILLLDATGDRIQVMILPDGHSLLLKNGKEQPSPDGWSLTQDAQHGTLDVRLPAGFFGYPSWQPDQTMQGLLAHAAWSETGALRLLACSSVPLGFSQRERFATFWLSPQESAGCRIRRAWFPDDRTLRLSIENTCKHSVQGVWSCGIESAHPPNPPARNSQPDAANAQPETPAVCVPIAIPAANSVELSFECPTPPRQFIRIHSQCWIDGHAQSALPTLSLCRPLAPLPADPPKRTERPCLGLDPDRIQALRDKVQAPLFRDLVRACAPMQQWLKEDHLPDEQGQFPLTFNTHSMGWSRVCRETLVRDGSQNRRPAAARIWSLLASHEQTAAHTIATDFNSTDAHAPTLVQAFNRMLLQRDLPGDGCFNQVHLPPEGKRLLARDANVLSEPELVRRNRILLQSAIECCKNFKVELAAKAGQYLLPWLLSGDIRLISLATHTAKAAADHMIPEASFHLHEGNCSPLLALSYDTFLPYLSEPERASWRKLLTILLDLYLESARKTAWTVSCIANSNPVTNAGAGMLALALWADEPTKAREALGWVRQYVWTWLDFCSGEDGGNTEGCQYWQYGTESWIRFACHYERFFGRDDGMLDHPAIRNAMNMVRVSLCNDGALHGCNDTVPVPCGNEIAWFLANRHNDSFALWYGDHAYRWQQQRAKEGISSAYHVDPFWAILYRPTLPEVYEQPEPLPQAFALRSIEYGMLRSSPQWNCRWTAGLKGSRPPYTHHNQPDTGSFFLDCRGDRLIIDPGYYKDAPTDHSLPLIDGNGPLQPQTYTGRIIACEQDHQVRYLALDATLAYDGHARRFVRHLLMLDENTVLVLDDLVPANPQAQIVEQFQCGDKTECRSASRTVLIHGAHACVRMSWPLSPPSATIALHPERPLHDLHWGYHFSRCRWFPVTLTCEPAPGLPILTLFREQNDMAAIPDPVFSCDPDGLLLITLPNGDTTTFEQQADGWTRRPHGNR